MNFFKNVFIFLPTEFPSVIKKYFYRRVCSASKSVGNIITDGFTDGQKITDERFTDKNYTSVISSVN